MNEKLYFVKHYVKTDEDTHWVILDRYGAKKTFEEANKLAHQLFEDFLYRSDGYISEWYGDSISYDQIEESFEDGDYSVNVFPDETYIFGWCVCRIYFRV